MRNLFKSSKKKEIQINFDPDRAAPLQFTKGITTKVTPWNHVNKFHTYGFISDVEGTGEPGILAHGTASGHLAFKNDFTEINEKMTCPIAFIYTPLELYNHIKERCGVDLKTFGGKKPLHLICCYGNAKNTMAQALANFLNRPVIAYGSGGQIHTSGARALFGKNKETTIQERQTKKNFAEDEEMRRLFGNTRMFKKLALQSEVKRPAEKRIYMPGRVLRG